MLRVTIRVQPRATRPGIGGARGQSLVVRVAAPPDRGKATEAALRAVADAFAVRHRDVRLIAGASSREKVVEIVGDTARLQRRLVELRDR